MNPPCDGHLEAALADLRHRCRRRKRGRVICTVEILEGVVVQHRCEETEMTERDVERVMAGRPGKGWTT